MQNTVRPVEPHEAMAARRPADVADVKARPGRERSKEAAPATLPISGANLRTEGRGSTE